MRLGVWMEVWGGLEMEVWWEMCLLDVEGASRKGVLIALGFGNIVFFKRLVMWVL